MVGDVISTLALEGLCRIQQSLSIVETATDSGSQRFQIDLDLGITGRQGTTIGFVALIRHRELCEILAC